MPSPWVGKKVRSIETPTGRKAVEGQTLGHTVLGVHVRVPALGVT